MEKNILKNFKKGFSLLNRISNEIYFSIGIFFLFFLLGFFIKIPSSYEEIILNYLRQLFEKIANFSFFELTSYIFLNNLWSSFVAAFSGIIFGVFSFVALVSNGFLLGFVSEKSFSQEGIFVLWKILPHGVFELPAIFISIGIGLNLTFTFFERTLKIKNYFLKFFSLVFILVFFAIIFYFSNFFGVLLFFLVFFILLLNFFLKDKYLFEKLKNSFVIFVFIVVPLLFVAALIEGALIYFSR